MPYHGIFYKNLNPRRKQDEKKEIKESNIGICWHGCIVSCISNFGSDLFTDTIGVEETGIFTVNSATVIYRSVYYRKNGKEMRKWIRRE